MPGAEADQIGRLLVLAERSIALLGRVTPTNFRSECEALLTEWLSGHVRSPRFLYPTRPPLPSGLKSALNTLFLGPPVTEIWQSLQQARAGELLLEAELAEAVGTATFAGLAEQRYRPEDRALEEAALLVAKTWVEFDELTDDRRDALIDDKLEELTDDRRDEAPTRSHLSDELRDPDSLGSLLQAEIGRRKLPFRLSFDRELVSLAAVGAGVIGVRSGVKLSRHEAQRVVVHEISGHAEPRTRAQLNGNPLFLVGTAGGFEDEEGRALLLEERAGFLDAPRKRQIAARHLAVVALRSGADWVEVVEKLANLGLELASAIEVACRVFRGGGWGREQIYLPGYLRVKAGLAAEPDLENWMNRGRISLAAARLLTQTFPAGAGQIPERSG